jgi:ABC-2 type transport system permease protein
MTSATFTHVVRSEWTKLRSLRSTGFTLLTAGALAVGLSVLFANGASRRSATPDGEFDPTAASLQSFILVQLAISVLGVLVVTSEYTTGMIRTSLAAVPRRGRLLTAKALVFCAVALVVGQLVAFASFLVGQAVLAGSGAPHVTLGEPAVQRAVIGCGLYLAMIGLLGVAVGVLARATAGGVMIMVGITLLVPLLTTALPETVAKAVGKFGPFGAGTQVMAVLPDPNLLTPWAGFGVLCLWVLAALAAALLVFRRRDA